MATFDKSSSGKTRNKGSCEKTSPPNKKIVSSLAHLLPGVVDWENARVSFHGAVLSDRRRNNMSTSQPSKKTALLTTSLRLICTDFDGTMAEPEHKPISPFFSSGCWPGATRPGLLDHQHGAHLPQPAGRTRAAQNADLARTGSWPSSGKSG
jgi:hypothetical protein